MDAIVAHRSATDGGSLADALPGPTAAPRPPGRPADPDRAGADAGPLRRRHRQPRADPAVLGHPRRQGHPARRLRLVPRRARALPRPVGAAADPRRGRPVVRGAGRDRGPAAAADVAGPAADREPARGRRRLRLLPVRQRGRRPGRARRPDDATARSGRASPSRASAATGTCAWPTSSGRARQRPGRRRRVPASSRWAPASPRRRPSCSPRTPTATTWSCTACRCSSPRRSPSTGTRGSATSSASAPRTTPRWRRSSGRATAARATPSATPPAPTWRTGRSWSSCWSPSGSASSCPRSSSCTPSSRPTPIVVHHPEAKYFNAR